MSIIDIDKIDSIGIDKTTDTLTMAISDHLTWEHENEHILLLEEKINLYVDFFKSGDIFKHYPQAKDKLFQIKIFFKHKLSYKAKEFINIATYQFTENNMNLSYEVITKKNSRIH